MVRAEGWSVIDGNARAWIKPGYGRNISVPAAAE
jgi:hypothetical protein